MRTRIEIIDDMNIAVKSVKNSAEAGTTLYTRGCFELLLDIRDLLQEMPIAKKEKI